MPEIIQVLLQHTNNHTISCLKRERGREKESERKENYTAGLGMDTWALCSPVLIGQMKDSAGLVTDLPMCRCSVLLHAGVIMSLLLRLFVNSWEPTDVHLSNFHQLTFSMLPETSLHD